MFRLFFQPQKIDHFFICLFEKNVEKGPGENPRCLTPSCRSCPTCRKKAQDVSVKVSPSMYLSKSQKRNRVWPMNFPPRDRSDFFTPFGKRLSKIKSSFFCVFNLCFFLLASYPKFQIHITIDTSIFYGYSCLPTRI